MLFRTASCKEGPACWRQVGCYYDDEGGDELVEDDDLVDVLLSQGKFMFIGKLMTINDHDSYDNHH